MSEINNNSNATGGSAKVVVTGQGEAAQKENLLQALLSFAMDIPRTVRTSATVWGVAIILVIVLSAGALYWNLRETMREINESQERIEKSLVNMHDKYNRITRYLQTGNPDNFSKSSRED